MNNAKKTILVTGGAGFIGSHLCERLLHDGHRVISLDNYFTGSRENHIDDVEYREGHTKDIERHVPETPDIVYHLGEYSRVAIAMEEPDIVLDLNITGTLGVLEFWRKRNVAGNRCKLVYAGSSTKLADQRLDKIEGRHLSPYTHTKAFNSELVRDYGFWYGLPWSIAYFYNVYGPRELSGRYGTVVEIFRQQYSQGVPRTMRLPGTQKRTYTHVIDTVNGLVLVAERGEADEYGIAAGETYTTREVAELFGGEIEELPARRTSRPSTPVDTSKLKALGWKQEHTLKEYVDAIKKEKR